MRSKEWLYAVIGGVVGAVLVMVVFSVLPTGPQTEVGNTEFGTITCREIRVIDSDGDLKSAISGDEHGGQVAVFGRGGNAGIKVGEYGGRIGVYSENSNGRLVLSVSKDGKGANVEVINRNGNSATINTADDGASVNVLGADQSSASMNAWGAGGVEVRLNRGGTDHSGAAMFTTKHGGAVAVSGKDGKGRATMSVDENGGQVGVYVKEDKPRAAMALDRYGNGAVNTWDKNGYRLK